MYNMDKLYDAVTERGHVCVGLDTAAEYLPSKVLTDDKAESILRYNKALVDATLDTAACYKVQIAYYEALGTAGLEAYAKTLHYIRSRKALVIADIKRGDIADTARRYAAAHFAGEFEADFVTLAPYMGMDSLDPWLSSIQEKGKGAFVLMRTSNPGMRDFEYRELKEGGRLYDAVGQKLLETARQYRGERGYGAVGAVVGCTEQEEAATIRKNYSSLFFLIPGYGAQGGAAADAARLLKNGNGGVVNASRSILKAWTKVYDTDCSLDKAAEAAAAECLRMRNAIQEACTEASNGD